MSFPLLTPIKLIEQFSKFDFSRWQQTYICCSGSFQIESFLRTRYPHLIFHSNDVCLYSTAIAAVALRLELEFKFIGDLAFIESATRGESILTRAGALLVAQEMSKHRSKNAFAQLHYQHFKDNFEGFLDRACKQLYQLADGLNLASYYCGDWQDRIEEAIATEASVLACPPRIQGETEKAFKFLTENVAWHPPAHSQWNPEDLPSVLSRLESAGILHLIVAPETPGFKPILQFTTRHQSLYGYGNLETSTLRVTRSCSREPFAYVPLKVEKLVQSTQVKVVWVEAKYANFIREIYLSKNCHLAPATFNALVYLDDMLAGCVAFKMDSSGFKKASDKTAIFFMAATVTNREMRMGKLLANIGTSFEIAAHIEAKILRKIDEVWASLKSEFPTNMKLRRGTPYKLAKRQPLDSGYLLHYCAPITPKTPQEFYAQHWKSYGKSANQNLRNRSETD